MALLARQELLTAAAMLFSYAPLLRRGPLNGYDIPHAVIGFFNASLGAHAAERPSGPVRL